MGINMNQEELGSSSSFLQIKELKEKVRSLISDFDLNHENTKFKHEKSFDNDSDDLLPIEDLEDEFIDFSEFELLDEINWLTNENHSQESLKDVCTIVYSDIEDDRPDISNLCRQLESSFATETNISGNGKPFIDSRTFTRPKKYSARSPLTSVINSKEEGRPKLQRRLTTTITPTPNLISKLEELSKSNNRPVSGNYDAAWEDNAREGLAEINTPVSKVKRQSLPASLFERLQELKKSNSNYKIPKIAEPSTPDEKIIQNEERNCMWEDAKKVKAALDVDMKDSLSSSRLSEIFRNTQDYYSDDNESFINLDEVSGFCDRLTMSTDQTTYSTIVKEMEQSEICLFHRTMNDTNPRENRLTFGGAEIPSGDFVNVKTPNRSIEEDNLLNRTYEIDEEESSDEKANSTYEIKNNVSKHNVMNSTYDANKAPGLLDAVLQSDIIKSISPNNGQKNNSGILDININNNNNNKNNNNNNNNKMLTGFEGNIMNRTFDKLNGTLNQNQLNFLHTEKYSTKVFDSSFRKQEPQIIKAEKRKNSFKRDNDHSEDECMSTTSDHSSKSLENNAEINTMEEQKNVAEKQNKKLFSTPISENTMKLDLDVVSPIRMEVGDGESQAVSNPSSRGHSPRRITAPMHQEGVQKQGMPILRQPLKVPQRELKLKPPLTRPSQTFKKGLVNARTSSEPSVPQKAESWQPVASVPVLRPAGPTAVPSQTNVRPLSRVSGIPRPPTRLKQPQIRAHHAKN